MIRELNHRVNDGIEVKLLWNSDTNGVSVSVAETRHDVSFEFEIAANAALDAFRHPYAYAVRAVAEMARVTRPSGRAAALEFDAGTPERVRQWWAWMDEAVTAGHFAGGGTAFLVSGNVR